MIDLRLIGYPIQHSLSPWIHQRFLKKASLEGSYSIYEIKPEQDFASEIDKLKEQNVAGFNVTVPYKEKIIEHLDELDESVKKIGAVNTVLNENGKWIGYNTDGLGYLKALTSKFNEIDKNKRVLIIGAGGAARGIYYAFIKEDFAIVDMANRTLEKGEKIIAMNDGATLSRVLTIEEAEEELGTYDIIVQTTSVGMKPNEDETVMSLENVSENAIVSDIVYQPIKTAFLQEAEKRGSSIHFGHTMLLYQAQLAFHIWTKQNVSVGNMDEQLQDVLEG